MTDIPTLLSLYNQLANEAKGQYEARANDNANAEPTNSNGLEALLKRHIRDLAREGGPGSKPLHTASDVSECPRLWILCNDGSCVPPEVGC